MMPSDYIRAAIARSRREHRAMEEWLDQLDTAIAGGDPSGLREAFAEARQLAWRHYAEEDSGLFEALAYPETVAKMRQQHEEARELAAACEILLAANELEQWPDLLRVARRFHAISQHNIIEEERDLFRWAEEWLNRQNALRG